MISLSRRAKIGIAILLVIATIPLAYNLRSQATSWAGAFVVASLIVAFLAVLVAFFIMSGQQLWQASRPKRLHLEVGERAVVRLGRMLVILGLLAAIAWISYRATRNMSSPWGKVLFYAALFCAPTVYWGLRSRIRQARIAAAPPPTRIKILYVPLDHKDVLQLPAFKGFCEIRRSPLEIAAGNPASVSAWHYPLPDFELYDAFKDQMTRGDKQLLTVGPLAEFSDHQIKRLKERAARTDVPCVLIESGSMDLTKTIFAQTTNEAYFNDLEIFDSGIEKIILELRSQLPDDRYLLVSYGFRWPLAIIASWSVLMQLKEQQNALAREVRQVLLDFVVPDNLSEDH